VTEVAVGDRVAIPWLGYACATCDYCVSGWETLCESQLNTGYSIDGGFAEYAKAHARHVVKVPQAVDPFDAAPLTCAGVTTYKAVKVSGAKSADLVAIWGIGGLGHLALQYANIAGGSVVAVDLIDEKLQLARELGAEFTVNAAEEDPVAAIKRLGGADAAVVLAVSPKAFEQAFASLRRGGTMSLVGLPAENKMELPIFETVLNGITVVGSNRRHEARPSRGVPASRVRQDARDPRRAAARRCASRDGGRAPRGGSRTDRLPALKGGLR
jgi:propanol-preferring alcohol dehydrogenase